MALGCSSPCSCAITAVLFVFAGRRRRSQPLELDYGEGIVWQQMRWIFSRKAYGPIDQFPAIVFHYPPLYQPDGGQQRSARHRRARDGPRGLAVPQSRRQSLPQFWSACFSTDVRAVAIAASVAASPACSCSPSFPSLLGAADARRHAGNRTQPVRARCGLQSLERPRLIYLASLLFVAAVYTKQTSIAAPVATFAVLLAVRPKLACKGLRPACCSGYCPLTLGWLTDGGFYRHIFLYNVNRLDLSRLSWILPRCWIAGDLRRARGLRARSSVGRGSFEISRQYRPAPRTRREPDRHAVADRDCLCAGLDVNAGARRQIGIEHQLFPRMVFRAGSVCSNGAE